MATAAVSGKDGSVAGQTGASEIKEWNADLTFAALDATSMASAGFMEFIGGLKGGTGSFTAIGTKPIVEEVATLTLKTDGGGTPSSTIAGKAIITSVGNSSVVDGVVTYSADFTFTGTITVT